MTRNRLLVGVTPDNPQPAPPKGTSWPGKLLLAVVLVGLVISTFSVLESAKRKAIRTSCASNMFQVGIAFQIWAEDHAGRFPFNMPAEEGGTANFRAAASNGFDLNSWL